MIRPLRVGPVAGAVLLAAAVPATATTGNLYAYGSSPTWTTGSQFASGVSNDVWTISSGSLDPALAGTTWQMNWACPVSGSVISQVKWSALRTAAPSHMEMDVLADLARVWSIPDAYIPRSPAGGQAYDIGLAAGTCNVHLRLVQTSTRQQGQRTYFIDHPRIIVRDLTPPTVSVTSLQGGWINTSQTHSEIRWSTSDNFGGDGVGEQRITIGGQLHYRGFPGAGSHSVNAGIVPVGDGVHRVVVQADGDGTGGATATGTLSIDLTEPSASNLSAAHTATPGYGRFVVAPTDGTSGVAQTQVEINDAGDGATGGAWSTIATQTGAATLADGSVRTSTVPDGLHAWRARVTDHAGNVGYAAGPQQVAVDTTAPSLSLGAPPRGHVRSLVLGYEQSDNLQAAFGLGASEFEANLALDGSAAGGWLRLATPDAGPGAHNVDLDLGGLTDGSHLMRVRARNGGGLGNSLFAERRMTVRVDNTSPEVSNVSFTTGASGTVDVAWIAQDALSGVARAVVQRRRGGSWQTMTDQAAASGAGRLSVDASSLPDGPLQLRLRVYDGAGNISETASIGAAVDSTPPSVTDLALAGGPPWKLTWTQQDAGGRLRSCATSLQVSGPGTNGAWREVASAELGAGTHSAALPVAGLPAGAYRVRVVVCDPSGNVASATVGGLAITGAELLGAGSTARDRFARLRKSRLTVSVAGARVERRRGRRTLVRALRGGQRLTITGRLRDRAGRPLRRELLHVQGYKRRVIGTTRTRANGRYRVRVRPEASGLIRVGAPAGKTLLPRRASARIRVLLRPRVTLAASRASAQRGQAVRIFGRIWPAPARLGGSRRKTIVLEWLDPMRHRWRPVVNGRVRRDGRFSFTWRFGVSGLTVPMRVRLPAERGWPLRPGRSRIIRVAVR